MLNYSKTNTKSTLIHVHVPRGNIYRITNCHEIVKLTGTNTSVCNTFKGQKRQRFGVMHLKEFIQANHLHLQSHFTH